MRFLDTTAALFAGVTALAHAARGAYDLAMLFALLAISLTCFAVGFHQAARQAGAAWSVRVRVDWDGDRTMVTLHVGQCPPCRLSAAAAAAVAQTIQEAAELAAERE